ncbi:hypothetical protein XENOCAPTIV_025985, partial [Xenoophorus captivus]
LELAKCHANVRLGGVCPVSSRCLLLCCQSTSPQAHRVPLLCSGFSPIVAVNGAACWLDCNIEDMRTRQGSANNQQITLMDEAVVDDL